MSIDYEFKSSGRTRATAITLVAVWLALAGAYVVLDAAIWILAILGLFSLPAVWDLVRDPKAGFRLSDDGIQWFSGPRDAEVPWSDVAFARFDTRLDFSVRVSFVLVTGRKIRVPFEATPPHEELERTLTDCGLKVERHHFSLLG